MSEVVQEQRLTMETLVENAIWLHCGGGQILKFVECTGGLYAHDRTNCSHSITAHIINTQTVETLKAKYTRHQVERANKARNLIWRLAKLISNNFFRR